MILNEFFYKYPCLQLLIHYRLSYVAITNSVTTTQPILSVVERYQEWKWPQLFFFWKYCKTPFTALLILTKRRHSQLFKSLPIWRRGFEKKIERWGGGGGLQLWGREFIGFDTFLLGVIFQYGEQHTKVSVEMKVIYLGLESRGKHHCQSLFKVVRYFPQKREKVREPKVQTWLKLNSKISTKYQNSDGGCLKGKHWHQIKSERAPNREQWGKRGWLKLLSSEVRSKSRPTDIPCSEHTVTT